MTNSALNESISILGNAYMQYLLYTKGVIKSSSLTTAHDTSDMARKLCFFLKTQWTKKLTDAGLVDDIRSIKIRNGSVIVEFPDNRWNNSKRIFSKLEEGFFQTFLSDNNMTNFDNVYLLWGGLNRISGSDICVDVRPDKLKQQALSEADRNCDATTSFLKSMYDEAYNHLICMRDMIVPIVTFNKHVRENIRDDNLGDGISNTYCPTFMELYYFLKSYNGTNIYDSSLRQDYAAFARAVDLTYNYAKANDMADRLHTFRHESPLILKTIESLYGWGNRSGNDHRAVINSSLAWVEGISRTLRGIGVVEDAS